MKNKLIVILLAFFLILMVIVIVMFGYMVLTDIYDDIQKRKKR